MEMLDQASVEGIAATFYANERPLQGVAGLMDWHFPRVVTDFVRSGAISGASDELVCIPVEYQGRPIRALLLGNGQSASPGERRKVSDKGLTLLATSVRKLRIATLAMSAKDFGITAKREVEALMPGVTIVWTT